MINLALKKEVSDFDNFNQENFGSSKSTQSTRNRNKKGLFKIDIFRYFYKLKLLYALDINYEMYFGFCTEYDQNPST